MRQIGLSDSSAARGIAIVSRQSTERIVAVVPVRHSSPVATLTIAGRSVLDHTLRALRATPEIGPIVVALEGPNERACRAAIRKPLPSDLHFTPPSPNRWAALVAALELGGPAARVLLLEPDRPLVSPAGMSALLRESRDHAILVTATPVHSSIKRVVDGRIVGTVPREMLQSAQSPWIFERGVLEEALRAAIALGWSATHEMELVRQSDLPVHLAEVGHVNVPVLSRADARFAEMAMERRIGGPLVLEPLPA